MNIKTTLALLVVLVVGAAGWTWLELRKSAESTHAWRLQDQLPFDKITRIEVTKGTEPRFVLEKSGPDWVLPGQWPVRTAERSQWLDQLRSLVSRFDPIPFSSEAELGLQTPALVIKMVLPERTITLRLAEKSNSTKSHDRPTFARIDERHEAIRLGPGVMSALDRSQDYFQQRRLFPAERTPKEEGSKEKIDQLVAKAIEVKSPTGTYRLAKEEGDWKLQSPVVDRVDPSKLQSLLVSVPDFWAEKFVDKKGRDLIDFGLHEPEFLINVTRPNGSEVKLLIGKISDTKMKFITKPAPPQQSPFQPPQKPQIEKVVEEYRFAKLADNDQIFEVKTDVLPKIAVPMSALRDPQLARFKSDEVKRITIRNGETSIILAKVDRKWKLEQPTAVDAEDAPITELLDKLAGLEAKEKDIVEAKDLTSIGLEKPATTIDLNLEDSKKDRQLSYQFGNKDAEKLYIRLVGNERINRVDAGLLKLVNRPAYAYRSRVVLEASDLHRVEIQKPDEKFTFTGEKGKWKLAEPVAAEIDAKLGQELAESLGKLEAIEYVADAPNDADLDQVYGLAKSPLTVKLTQDEKKPAKTLSLGKPRAGKDDYYARLDQGPIFTVKKALRDKLERGSLQYLPLQVWQLAPEQITSLSIKKGNTDFTLQREEKSWKLTGPVESTAAPNEADELLSSLAQLKAERYEAHQGKDEERGLDKPYLKIHIATKEAGNKDLLVGVQLKDATSRYARLGDSSAIFVVDAKTLAPLDRGPLDLLERRLLTLDAEKVRKIQVAGPMSFTLQKQEKDWQIIDSPAPAFKPDDAALKSTLGSLSLIEAAKIEAFGKMIDWASYELDKPAVTVTITTDGEKDKDHRVALGKTLPTGQRYARVDGREEVAVLDARSAEIFGRSHLDFVDVGILRFDLDAIAKITRQMKDADVEFAKQADGWQYVKPTPRRADEPTVSNLLDMTFRLRAKRVAAYPAKDLAKFGLESPTATLILEGDGKDAKKHVLKIGEVASEVGERFAQLEGNDSVVVLDADLSQVVVAPILFFADRQLTGLVAPDRAIVERAGRKVTFTKDDGPWKMIEPIAAKAEDSDLEDLVRSLQRLRAEVIVADTRESDPKAKAHGLEEPTVQWRFKMADQEILHILLGNAETGTDSKNRFYAQFGEKGPIVLLPSKLAQRLQDEYRDRKPMPALDAAQANQLTIQEPDGKKFTLEKREVGWGVVGSPDAKVDLSIVTDTLDALAGLKVRRYVSDAKGDLKLHGLDPAVWKIEVRTPAGGRSLLLGRNEGETSRTYAAVPDNDSIFVLDEVTSTRLARRLSAFLKEK